MGKKRNSSQKRSARKKQMSRIVVPQGVRDYFAKNNIPPVVAKYVRELFRLKSGREFGVFHSKNVVIGRHPNADDFGKFTRYTEYFSMIEFEPEYENPYFGCEGDLEKALAKVFCVKTEYDFTLLESSKDVLDFAFSINFDATINDKKIPTTHTILVVAGNAERAKKEKVEEYARRVLY